MTDLNREERMIVFAPTGKDAELTCRVLQAAGIECFTCLDAEQVLREMNDGIGALLLVEETLTRDFVDRLSRRIFDQPNWSDLPILLLSSVGASSRALNNPVQMLGNVTVLERPVRALALISAAGAALRARKRQYGVRETDQRKDEFLASLGHELRNPLAPIRTAAGILCRMHPESPEIGHICGVVERQVAHLTRLVDDLLDVARITRGKVVLQRAPTTLSAVINQAVEICAELAGSAGHEIAVSLPATETTIVADHARLVQAVANVLSNAIKFTPRPGRISLDAVLEGDDVEIRVRDPGIGLETDTIARIFDLFTQNEVGTAQVKAGLGIGLSLTRQFIEMHGGSVCAYSEGLGHGAQFVLMFPRDAAAHVERDAASHAAPAQAIAQAMPVLIVDDNQDAADMLVSLFRSHGYDTTAAYNGCDAVLEAARLTPEVIVMDLGMPGMDGYEAARRIRQSPGGRSLVMIALTGWGQEGTRKKALEAGFDFHAVKPVDIDVLKNYIAQSRPRHDSKMSA
ncbi:MAG: hybrid sensor histidine kinase/response regulator [Betaproteobacteria bacterium]|nr:hybrid sensor histidine kinase/response regulator [Betaproteobacteria bacterium]